MLYECEQLFVGNFIIKVINYDVCLLRRWRNECNKAKKSTKPTPQVSPHRFNFFIHSGIDPCGGFHPVNEHVASVTEQTREICSGIKSYFITN